MGKQFLRNGAFSGIAEAGKPQADPSEFMESDYKPSRWNRLRYDVVTVLPQRGEEKNGIRYIQTSHYGVGFRRGVVAHGALQPGLMEKSVQSSRFPRSRGAQRPR